MKKIYILTVFALIAVTGYGQAPIFQWGAVVRSNDQSSTSGFNTPNSIKTNDAGDIFVSGTFVSHATSAFKYITYKHYDAQGTLTPTESPEGAKTTTAVSGNHNLYLYKLNKEGEIQWQITSDRGYVDNAYSQFVPTPDGGVFLVLCVRLAGNNEFEDNRLIRIVEHDKTKPVAGIVKREGYDPNVNTNTDQGVAVKIDAEGHVEWSRHIIRVDDSKIGDRLATTAIYFNDLAIDPDGNYWLAGRHLKTITFDKPDATEQALIPHNVEGWNGDAQQSRGDALFVKLNPEGKLLWNLETTGIVDYQSVNSIQYNDGELYIYGNVAATPDDETSSTSLLGHTIYPSAKTNAWSARLNLTGNEPSAGWVTLLKSLPQTDGKGGRIKVTTANYDNGALFLAGSLTGFIVVDGDTILANDTDTGITNYLKGFFIRQDPDNGEILGAAIDPAGGLAVEIENIAFRKDTIYTFGYSLGQTWIHVYDTDYNYKTAYGLLGAEGATAWDALFLNDRIVTVNRGRNLTSISGAPEVFTNDATPAYSAYYLSYQFDGLDPGTAIPQNIFEPAETVKVTALRSALRITGHATVRIINLTGIPVYSGNINGEKEIPLPAGIYIVSANGKAIKTIVR